MSDNEVYRTVRRERSNTRGQNDETVPTAVYIIGVGSLLALALLSVSFRGYIQL